MRVPMKDLAGTTVLAGALNGRKALADLLHQAQTEPRHPEPLFLDFQGVEVATASFLREAVLGFRDAVRRARSKFYSVVANANPLVTEELQALVAARGDVLLLCTLKDDVPSRPRLVGDLDPKQKFTFDLVRKRGETDAAELMRQYGESEGVKQTAWNNRLSALASLGLVVETSQGRAKRYRPLFVEQ